MLKPIKTHTDYENTLERIYFLMQTSPEDNSPEFDELQILSVLVEDYESKNYCIPAPDPIEAIKYEMERKGLTKKDLIPVLGSFSRVSEILNRKRKLTLNMIKNLHTTFKMPYEMLLQV